MRPRLWVKKLAFNGGTVLDFNSDDIIVFVGPNNAGKSAALRAIDAGLNNVQTPGPVIMDVEFGKIGTSEDLLIWLNDHAFIESTSDPRERLFRSFESYVFANVASTLWGVMPLSDLAGFFCCFLKADSRLSIADPVASLNLSLQPPQAPHHYMMRFESIELDVSRAFRKAFGQDLIVHRNSGSIVPLYVGDKSTLPSSVDRSSYEYCD